MKRVMISVLPIFVVLIALTISASGRPAHQADNSSKPATQQPSSTQADPGEKVFNTNCARCHQPPMALPPRITGTIVMHMRVRARLSRQDERLLLKFLAP